MHHSSVWSPRKNRLAYCTKCGAENNPGSAFCYYCGSRLVAINNNQSQEDPVPQSAGSLQPLPPTDPPGVERNYQQWEPMRSPPPGHRANRGAIITFVITLAIVAILIWVAYTPGLIDLSINSNPNSSHSVQLHAGNYNVTYSWVYPYGSNRE